MKKGTEQPVNGGPGGDYYICEVRRPARWVALYLDEKRALEPSLEDRIGMRGRGGWCVWRGVDGRAWCGRKQDKRGGG